MTEKNGRLVLTLCIALASPLVRAAETSNGGPRQLPSAETTPVGGGAPAANGASIPGTEATVKVSGFAALDAITDISGGGMGGSVSQPQAVPLEGSTASTRTGQLYMTARRTRGTVNVFAPTAYGPGRLLVEGDLYGAGGNEVATNSAAFRLRLAYATLGPFLAGQAETNFASLRSFPEVVDFWGGHGVVNRLRTPQARVTLGSGGHEVALSVENPETDVVGVSATTFVGGLGSVPTNTIDRYPDVILRYEYAGGWGRVAVAGVGRRLTVNNKGQAAINGFVGETSVSGAAGMLAGRIFTFGKDSLQFAFEGGSAVGRYVLGNPGAAAVIRNGRLEAVTAWGAGLGYQLNWTATLRSNVLVATARSDNPHPVIAQTATSAVDSVFANVVWNPTRNIYLGLEYVHVRVKSDAAATATLSNRGRAERVGTTFQFRL